jgi:hypothetical protein
VSATYSGAGVDDTSSFNWGDGTTDAGTASAGIASGSHVYTEAGVYTVEIIMTDGGTGSATKSFQYVVVYDPSAGFVTGGGWIDSPAGAYTADKTLTGKAHFGFVSRYKKGATTPDGNTQFQFQSGNFSFHSTVYDWLVISGAKAQYKGSGTVNGTGDYGFLLTATDGQLSGSGIDTFRLKIWDKATDTVVYDNQLGDDDTADASNAIGGGSIVIHKAKK